MTRVDDIQGNILRGYASHSHVAYVFTEITDPALARRLLSTLRPRLATERDWETRPVSRLNVAFTYPGLERLEVPLASFGQFPDFRGGMSERARTSLGDLGANDPQYWDADLTDRAHVLFTVYGEDRGHRTQELTRLRGEIAAGGMQTVCIQEGDSLTDSREHFGFDDGFSQPAIEGVAGDRRSIRGEGAQRPRWRLMAEPWRSIRLGEFVLGYRDEDGVTVGREDRLLRNGTFMVWRKLEQDVDGFQEWIRAQIGADDDAAELLKARIVGRWPNGASLIRRPPGASPAPGERVRDRSEQ